MQIKYDFYFVVRKNNANFVISSGEHNLYKYGIYRISTQIPSDDI